METLQKQIEKKVTNGLDFPSRSLLLGEDHNTDIDLQIHLAQMDEATTSDYERKCQLKGDIGELQELSEELKSLGLQEVYNTPEKLSELILIKRWVKKHEANQRDIPQNMRILGLKEYQSNEFTPKNPEFDISKLITEGYLAPEYRSFKKYCYPGASYTEPYIEQNKRKFT